MRVNCKHEESTWLPRGLMSLIILAVVLLSAMDALAWESGFPLSIASPTLEVDGSWDLYWDSHHISAQDGSRSMFRRCSGDRDKGTCLTFLRHAGNLPEPIVVCGPLGRNSNQVPLGFSRHGLLIWEPASSVYSFGEDNRCKPLNLLKHDIWDANLAPDGARIAYLAGSQDDGVNLFVYNLDTSRTTQLTNFRNQKSPRTHGVWWIREREKIGLINLDRQIWLSDRAEGILFEISEDDGFGPTVTWWVRPDGSGLQQIVDVPVKSTLGWSNDTGHKHAETPQQRAIVAAAMNHSKDSPQSIATGSNVVWETDTKGGDGQRMRDAIQVVYDYWVQIGQPALRPVEPHLDPLPKAVQEKMRTRLRATYSKSDQDAFITQITSVFNGTVPGTDNETLQYLGIRAQCKEFADRIVQAGGGKTHTYSEGKALAANPGDIRPGMYAFKRDFSQPDAPIIHAAIIVAVKWDANGQATHMRLAEANWGTGWTNPNGQVPWERVVTTTRPVPVSEFFVVPTDSSDAGTVTH